MTAVYGEIEQMYEPKDYGESVEPQEEARRAVQLAMDRRDNGGDGE